MRETIEHDDIVVSMVRGDIPCPVNNPPKDEGRGRMGSTQPCCQMYGFVPLPYEGARNEGRDADG
jgi:hypothetical protein